MHNLKKQKKQPNISSAAVCRFSPLCTGSWARPSRSRRTPCRPRRTRWRTLCSCCAPPEREGGHRRWVLYFLQADCTQGGTVDPSLTAVSEEQRWRPACSAHTTGTNVERLVPLLYTDGVEYHKMKPFQTRLQLILPFRLMDDMMEDTSGSSGTTVNCAT